MSALRPGGGPDAALLNPRQARAGHITNLLVQEALARQEGTPAQAPAPSVLPTREAPAITFLAVPEVCELIHTVKDLVARVAALEAGTRDPPAPARAKRVTASLT